MLDSLLRADPYAIALSPGFFQFYALTGELRPHGLLPSCLLHGLEDHNCLRVSHASGSSAGALVAGFLAAGMSPSNMIDHVLSIQRTDIWDMGGYGGLLKGELAQELIERFLPVQTFEECPIPLGVTAWELFRFRTKIITSGHLATAIRASLTFPLLFQPVKVDNTVCIDGGIFDNYGLMALPDVPESNLIVNVIFNPMGLNANVLPPKFKDARLLTLVMKNIPGVTPFSMHDKGPLAYRTARAATHKALRSSHIQQLAHNHWCCYIDGDGVDVNLPLSIPSRLPMPDVPEVDGDQALTTLRKTPSFTFLSSGMGSRQASQSNINTLATSNSRGSNLIDTDLSPSSNAMEITPDLDMLLALCENEPNLPYKIQPSKSSNEGKEDIDDSYTFGNSNSYQQMEQIQNIAAANDQITTERTKRKRKRKMDYNNPHVKSNLSPSSIMKTDALMALCRKHSMQPVPIPSDAFDDIDEVSREDSIELTEYLIDESKDNRIAVLVQTMELDSAAIENNLLSPRKSRRKSTSTFAAQTTVLDKWVLAYISRTVTAKERQLGFSHAVRYCDDSDKMTNEETLVSLTVFGYFNILTGDQYKPDKLSLQQNTWVSLK